MARIAGWPLYVGVAAVAAVTDLATKSLLFARLGMPRGVDRGLQSLVDVALQRHHGVDSRSDWRPRSTPRGRPERKPAAGSNPDGSP